MADRELILRRRAAFLSSALLVAGCEQTGLPAPQAPAIEIPPAQPGVVSTSPRPSSSAPDRFPPLGGAPPDAPPEQAGQYQKEGPLLLDRLRPTLARIDRMEAEFPQSCAGGCKEALAPVADELSALRAAIEFLEPRCPASSPEGKALEQWQAEHQKYLERRLARLEQAAQELAQREEGEVGEMTWSLLLRPSYGALVCLSCKPW